ncbi:MAG TPA: translation initiation factor [Phycisphaerae bacterium]|nr:translation initiation factor [Phycisphaerae bacterium]
MSRLFSGTSFDNRPRCERCGKSAADCRCLTLPPKKKMSAKNAPPPLDSGLTLTPQNATPPPDQLARISLQKRKSNRVVTLIAGLDHPANDLPKLCTDLKQSLSTGGSVQDRTIELQGDHTTAAHSFLTARNIRARIL